MPKLLHIFVKALRIYVFIEKFHSFNHCKTEKNPTRTNESHLITS